MLSNDDSEGRLKWKKVSGSNLANILEFKLIALNKNLDELSPKV